jgi:hypothetical protein
VTKFPFRWLGLGLACRFLKKRRADVQLFCVIPLPSNPFLFQMKEP